MTNNQFPFRLTTIEGQATPIPEELFFKYGDTLMEMGDLKPEQTKAIAALVMEAFHYGTEVTKWLTGGDVSDIPSALLTRLNMQETREEKAPALRVIDG